MYITSRELANCWCGSLWKPSWLGKTAVVLTLLLLMLQCPALQAAVLLGDDALDKSVQWDLVRFDVNYASAGKGGKAPGSPQTRMQTLFQPQATISHQFRQPDKRPPAAISLLFAAATAVPLVLLAAALLQLGVNFKVSHQHHCALKPRCYGF